uniref:U30-Theraphotoxin-Ct1e_1 n=1 Tax=Coremiocnemis tropix TaxID=1904443 RepID=A0A482ZBF2_CORTR
MRFHVILMLSWFWLEVNGDTCPAIYLRYAKQHTFCLPPKSSCTILRNTVTQSDKEVIPNWIFPCRAPRCEFYC